MKKKVQKIVNISDKSEEHIIHAWDEYLKDHHKTAKRIFIMGATLGVLAVSGFATLCIKYIPEAVNVWFDIMD